MSMFAEVRNDYWFEEPENGIISGVSIDAWKTGDDNEEGQVVANVVLTEHNDILVVWCSNAARYDEECLLAIEEAKAMLKNSLRKETNLPDTYAEIDYGNRYDAESINGSRWDDMNYQHYMER